jgi:hypothetical protein
MELGNLKGFPDSQTNLNTMARVWARFVSLEPHRCSFNPQVAQFMSQEEMAPYLAKQGVVPGEWLMQTIQDTCEWMPAPVQARRMYCAGGFRPFDGKVAIGIEAGQGRKDYEMWPSIDTLS